jgi:hypothetical protein
MHWSLVCRQHNTRFLYGCAGQGYGISRGRLALQHVSHAIPDVAAGCIQAL